MIFVIKEKKQLMELSLSTGAQKAIEKIRKIVESRSGDLSEDRASVSIDKNMIDGLEIVNVDEMYFSDDETWLYECPVNIQKTRDIFQWLYSNSDNKCLNTIYQSLKKNIDSRTFTRPKKACSRPSINVQKSVTNFSTDDKGTKHLEKDEIIEEVIVPEIIRNVESCRNNVRNKSVEMNDIIQLEPLNFDLREPLKSNIFDKIFTSQGMDSFQNMSPPSLVNSLCSSTFTNLMENSYIKNDPILREIRDTDYSEMLLQDCESPMFHSITGSCSSLFSDVAESLSQKNLESTFNISSKKKSVVVENDKLNENLNSTFTSKKEHQLNNTYCKNMDCDKTLSIEQINSVVTPSHDFEITKLLNEREAEEFCLEDANNETCILTEKKSYENVSGNNYNYSTFVRKKSPASKITPNTNTYRKSSLQKSNTFRISSNPQSITSNNQITTPNRKDNDFMNRTVLQPYDTTVIVPKENNFTVHQFSYIIDDNGLSFPVSANPNVDVNIKHDETVCPFGGSEDSLHQMSSLSNSSKGSKKVLNMADVDAIVRQQEKNLHDISTPKPNMRNIKEIWNDENISPICSVHTASDSEIEREDFLSVRSSHVKLTSAGSDTSLQSVRKKSNVIKTNINGQMENVLSGQGDDFTLPHKRLLHNRKKYKTTGGSDPNLPNSEKDLKFHKGFHTNLNPICKNLRASANNLENTASFMDSKLMNITRVVEDREISGTSDRVQNQLLLSKENQPVKVSQANLKSKLIRPSGLPRPVSMYGTGIPRPVSKMSAPRSNIRSLSTKSVAM